MRRQVISTLYRLTRFLVKRHYFFWQPIFGKTKDLETIQEFGKKNIGFLTKGVFKKYSTFHSPKKLETIVHDLTFSSPLTFAAYEAHLPLLTWFMQLGIGGGCIKTMMTEPRNGNQRPRLQEINYKGTKTLINALGLPGKGVKKQFQDLKNSNLFSFNRPMGLSIGGHKRQEYEDSFMAYHSFIQQLSFPFYYEVNISCPNTDEGQDLSKNLNQLEKLLVFMRHHTDRVISVKLSPDQANQQIRDTADLISHFKKMVINCGNTQRHSCESVGLKQSALSIGMGGLSGAHLFPRTLEMIHLLKPFNVALMATGGIDCVDKVKAVQSEGAQLIGMATALVFDPTVIVKINHQLAS